MGKQFKNVGITALALGTAYGLGILSCVVYEVKLFAMACEATKNDSKDKKEA